MAFLLANYKIQNADKTPNLVESGILELFSKYNKTAECYFAGGCFKDILLRQKMKDIDVFFDDVNTVNKLSFYLLAHPNDYILIFESSTIIRFGVKPTTKDKILLKLIEFNHGRVFNIELNKKLYYDVNASANPSNKDFMLNKFDFIHTKFMLKASKHKTEIIAVWHKDFYNMLNNRQVAIDTNYALPDVVSTYYRLLNILSKGWKIDPLTDAYELLKLLHDVPAKDIKVRGATYDED